MSRLRRRPEAFKRLKRVIRLGRLMRPSCLNRMSRLRRLLEAPPPEAHDRPGTLELCFFGASSENQKPTYISGRSWGHTECNILSTTCKHTQCCNAQFLKPAGFRILQNFRPGFQGTVTENWGRKWAEKYRRRWGSRHGSMKSLVPFEDLCSFSPVTLRSLLNAFFMRKIGADLGRFSVPIWGTKFGPQNGNRLLICFLRFRFRVPNVVPKMGNENCPNFYKFEPKQAPGFWSK